MNGHEALDKLAFRFFKLFAQYEYALKAMGYGSAGHNRQAEVDWDRFSNEIGVAVMVIEAAPIVEARQYILENPPRRQIWVNNTVQWEGVANNDRSPQMLFSHIRRIRNNLYHGGKFNGRWIDPDRSEQLIGNALLLLESLVPLNEDLSQALHGNQA
jgi:hypothetical protein